MIKRKGIAFDQKKQNERELWDWIDTLPHGTFSEDTKAYWLGRMREAKEEQS